MDLEAVVKDAVSDGVDQILAKELGGGAIILDFMEAGFHTIFIITMVQNEG